MSFRDLRDSAGYALSALFNLYERDDYDCMVNVWGYEGQSLKSFLGFSEVATRYCKSEIARIQPFSKMYFPKTKE